MIIRPFSLDILVEAGVLLAERHRANRQVHPLLPERFSQSHETIAAIRALWERPQTTGVAAFSQGRLTGFLIGTMVIDELWGRSAWVEPAGLGRAADTDPEILRELYAALAASWVAQGIYTHIVRIPTADSTALNRFFTLSFGVEQVHGLRLLTDKDGEPTVPPNIEIRRVTASDRPILELLSETTWRHQVEAPVWGIHLPERQAVHRQQYSDLATDPAAMVYLAFCEGEPAGLQCYYAAAPEPWEIAIPEACAELYAAGTRPVFRRRGINTLLTQTGFSGVRNAGFGVCLTDWRSTNLLSSRFWPRRGFCPVVYRLVRRVDPRIAWAHGVSGGGLPL